MLIYYNAQGKVLGKAYGFMKCKTHRAKGEHSPHRHNPEFTLYGPYFCPGWPETLIYDAPPRKALNDAH